MTTTFPAHVLGIKVEILLNGVWTDISLYVQQRNNLQIINMGRPDWTNGMQSAELTLTLNNRDGRFTPKNSAGAYYPNITRNVQLRLSIDAESATLVIYQGYRFWGEVASWPPKWDPTEKDIYCDIVVTGIWRRMSQTKTTLGSAYQRYNSFLTPVHQGYWSLEDGSGAPDLVCLTPGGASGSYTGVPSLAGSSDFIGSNGIVVFNAAALSFTVPAGGTPTNNVTRFLLSVPAAGDSASGTTNWNIAEVDSSGTVAKLEVYLNFSGTLLLQGRNASGTILFTQSTTTNVKGVPVLVSMELTPSGANVAWALRIIRPGDAAVLESITGTWSTASVGGITAVKLGRANALNDTAVGHLSVSYAAPASLVAAAYALNGYRGELALDRFNRLLTEENLPHETIGISSDTPAMGPQLDVTIIEHLQQIEDIDCGLLYESRTQFAIGYRDLKSISNQVAAATLDHNAAVLAGDLQPTYDDQFIRNNITVQNWTGYTSQAVLTVGAISILAPPNGVGEGYEYNRTINAYQDSQVSGIANWLLNIGAVDEVRIPTVTLDMRRSEVVALFATIPGLRVGDYIQITNPPAFLSSVMIKQLVYGYTETLNAFEWTFTFNTIPESPYETGFTPGTVQTKRLPGGSSVASQSQWQKSIAAMIRNGMITPSMLNEGITVRTLGGTAVTVSDPAPSSPNLNDIWINATTGLISEWNGSAWAAVQFDASVTVKANSIVTNNIAAGQITAALMAAGIVVAGIVDTTVINASTLLIYSGDPGAGSLVGSFASAAGTDNFGTTFPVGIEASQATFTGITIGSSGISGTSIVGGSITDVPVQNPAITGGTMTETNITFDQTGGILNVYTSTTTTVTLTDPTVNSWTAPAGSYTTGKVECWGADAGAGGGGTTRGGEGGGGGGYSAEGNYPLVPGATYSIQVGAGGTGGATGFGGTDGGDTVFDQQGVTANGGNAGSGYVGGTGGPASGNSVSHSGGNGGGDNTQSTGGCGGGGRAGATGNGGNGAKSTSSSGAAGGSAGAGSGGIAGGAGGNAAANGGTGAGGGGCGAATQSNQGSNSYRLSSSITYYGSDGSNPNAQRTGVGSSLYQGGETASGGGYNGTMKSLGIIGGNPSGDLSGKTIDSVNLRLKNLHSWYNSGQYAILGYTNHTSLPSTWNASGITGVKTFWTDQLSNRTYDLTNMGLGSALQSGAAKALCLGPGPAYNLWNYGYYYGAGGDNNQNPLLTVTWHTGSVPVKAGNGANGQIKITYVNSQAMVASIAPAAGTDSLSNQFAEGYTGKSQAYNLGTSPLQTETWVNVTPPSGWSGVLRYKLTAEYRFLFIDCQITHAGYSGNLLILTVPAGLLKRPTAQKTFPIAITSNTAPNTYNQRGWFATDGTLNTFGLPTSTTGVFFCTMVPLD